MYKVESIHITGSFEEYREIFLNGNASQIDNFLLLTIVSFVVFLVSVLFVKSFEKEIRDHL